MKVTPVHKIIDWSDLSFGTILAEPGDRLVVLKTGRIGVKKYAVAHEHGADGSFFCVSEDEIMLAQP